MRSSPLFEIAGEAWYSALVRSCLMVVGVVMVGEVRAPGMEPGAVGVGGQMLIAATTAADSASESLVPNPHAILPSCSLTQTADLPPLTSSVVAVFLRIKEV